VAIKGERFMKKIIYYFSGTGNSLYTANKIAQAIGGAELVNCYSAEMNFLGLTDLNALSLTQVQVLPHYGKFISRFEQFEEKCRTYEKTHNVNVIRINDGEGVFIDKEIHICRL
jgi:flavodoxin